MDLLKLYTKNLKLNQAFRSALEPSVKFFELKRDDFVMMKINLQQIKQLYTLIILNMKKLQNYLMKPQQLRKKLQNPRFRHEFVQWSKSNLSMNKDSQSKHSRSKSPVENNQKSLLLNMKKSNPLSGKENIRTNYSQKMIASGSKSNPKNYLTTKNGFQDRNKSQAPIKRNVSNAILNKNAFEKQVNDPLSSKNRYNSCTSIDYQKRPRSSSNLTNLHQQSAQKKKYLKLKYSYRTKQGVQANNPNKTNQDSLVIKTNLADKDINLFAVADGHGQFGHLVSQFIAKNISKTYESELKQGSLHECIPKVFQKIQKGLTNSQFNVSCSGSTLVNILIDKDEVICANVGDSRAILARQIDRKSWEMIYLSQDHKPNLQAQKKRIIKNGGRIHAFKDQNGNSVGPLRVWLPNQNLQGLAMSRSFGDNVSKTIGVTAQPQIIRMKLDKRDKFVLLASDGVWQFISNQQVLQLIVPFYRQNKLEEACDALLKLAYQRWTVEDTTVVDDITLVLIFLSE